MFAVIEYLWTIKMNSLRNVRTAGVLLHACRYGVLGGNPYISVSEQPHSHARSKFYGNNTGQNFSLGSGMYREIYEAPPDPHLDARSIFRASVQSVLPAAMVKRVLKREGDRLTVGDSETYRLNRNVHVVAFGKAVLGMLKATEEIIGRHIVDGVASVPHNIQATLRKLQKSEMLPSPECPVTILEGARNNIPDEDAHRAALQIADLLNSCGRGDIVLALISGGGSALLPSPIPPLTLDDLSLVTKVISQAGAKIQELNLIRRHLELLKGGGLAKAAFPAKVITLILSDTTGNDLQFIASGPTAPLCTTAVDCLALFKSLGVEDKLPKTVYDVIGRTDKEVTTPDANGSFPHVRNFLIGTNSIALDAAIQEAKRRNYMTLTLTSLLDGDADEVGRMFARLGYVLHRLLRSCADTTDDEFDQRLRPMLEELPCSSETSIDLKNLLHEARSAKKPLCILAGGETTVKVTGSGTGGRSQQMALSSAIAMDELFQDEEGICFLSCGTDGQDGPCEAAGAIADRYLVSQAACAGLTPADYLSNNDTFTFFSKVNGGRYHVVTGYTGTNVMDIQVLLVF